MKMQKEKVEAILAELTEKERAVLKEAVTVLWLNDSSDYINGLCDIIRVLMGEDIDIDDVYPLLREQDEDEVEYEG